MKRLGLSTLGLILGLNPAMLLAQKKEDFIALQRDVAALEAHGFPVFSSAIAGADERAARSWTIMVRSSTEHKGCARILPLTCLTYFADAKTLSGTGTLRAYSP